MVELRGWIDSVNRLEKGKDQTKAEWIKYCVQKELNPYYNIKNVCT